MRVFRIHGDLTPTIFALVFSLTLLVPGNYLMASKTHIIADFSNPASRTSWRTINDGVMGGISTGEIHFTEHGSALFQGALSLENNGGFASVRQSNTALGLDGLSGLRLQVIGDGREYQLRVRTDDRYDGIAYRYRFTTSPKTPLTISAPFPDFEPVYRGRSIPDAPPLDPAKIEQLGFLIADKREGPFRLEIKLIEAF